jgi:hypothetical protein
MLKTRVCLAVFLVTVLFAATASAASVALTWDPNKEPEVTGYKVLVGSTPGGTDQTVDVGPQVNWTFASGVAGRTYYFRVQAYTAAGLTSLSSNEVSWVAPLPTTVPPFGSFDTPTNNATGLTGSIAVTGWALDDTGVTRVRILRAPVAGEPAGTLVYIGDAAQVPGARPDIAAAYPAITQKSRAGWGYLLLSLFLPNLGNGTFTLYAYADDGDGHSTLLGTKTITCANASSVTPFGAIDTPTQGQTVGSSINNFGWVLAPGTRRADPVGGGTVRVVIDGVAVGVPTGWTSRADLTSLFPAAQYSGISKALGVYTFDSHTLADGLHTIAWAVTDNKGGTAGVGSRYFTVANGAGVAAAAVASGPAMQAAAMQAGAPVEAEPVSATRVATPLVGRRGFDLNASFRTYKPNAAGVVVVQSEELDRIELYTGSTTASLVTANGLERLPIGAGLDDGGVFRWQPGVGFLGSYDFVFSGQDGSRQVRVVLNPKGSGRVGPQVVIDTPSRGAQPLAADQPFNVAGWAADLDAEGQTGVEAVHVWAYPRNGADPMFLGSAALNGVRPDVAAVYGDRFKSSGYGVTATGLPAGDYNIAVFAWSTVLQGFAPASTVSVKVR